jgi:hypothetical protein
MPTLSEKFKNPTEKSQKDVKSIPLTHQNNFQKLLKFNGIGNITPFSIKIVHTLHWSFDLIGVVDF